jgi:putative nucleotidyltransferase with HDIG domain
MNKRQEIIESIAAVPPLPTASAEVIRMIQDPKVPSGRIAQAIEYDPSLTTNVLRLANSSFFGFHRSVSTVKDALFRLGTNQVFQLVVAATVGKMAQTPVNGYDLSSGDLWDHLVGTAIASVKLAQTLKIEIPSYTFTAALTHDVGKVVLGTFLEVNAESVRELAYEEKMPFEQAERQVLEIDHAEVGALLLERWNLPEDLVDVVRWHHQPEEYRGKDPRAANVVHVANVLCLMAGVGAGLDALSYKPSAHAMEQLGLEIMLLDEIVYEILSELMETRKLFKLS